MMFETFMSFYPFLIPTVMRSDLSVYLKRAEQAWQASASSWWVCVGVLPMGVWLSCPARH